MKSENGPISDFKSPGFRSHKTWSKTYLEPLFSKFFYDFKICVAPENKGDIRASYAVPQVALNSRDNLDVGWDTTNHRKRGAPAGSVPSSRPRQRSRPSSDREKIPQRMKAAAVIVLVLSTVVTSVVVHRLLRPILERNEYYACEKRERENRGVTENFVFVSCGTAVHLERHEKIRNIFCGTSGVVVAVNVVSRIQRILVAHPKNTTLHGGQSRSWSAEQGKENIVQLD